MSRVYVYEPNTTEPNIVSSLINTNYLLRKDYEFSLSCLVVSIVMNISLFIVLIAL